MYSFEKLKAWQESVKLVKMVYRLAQRLPIEEKFGLSDQVKRACTSIALNIAEGSASKSKKHFLVYLENSLRSLYETIGALKLIQELFGLEVEEILKQCDLVHKLIQGLKKNLTNN